MADNPYMVKIGESGASGGVFTGSYPCQAITDIQNLGATWLFYQVMWAHIDPSATGSIGSYVMGNFDAVVSQCNQAGINIVLALFTPPSAFIKPGTSLSAIPADMATYAQNIARAYTTGSGFQRGTRTIQGLYIGNEDYDGGGSGGEAADLVAVMKATYPVVKAVNSGIKVIAGAKIQRNTTFYDSWFDTLLHTGTGAWTSGTFQADVITYHYHTALPTDPTTGASLSLDPRVDVGNIPSWQTCWQHVQTKMNLYSCPAELWCDENGENVNTNPSRTSGSVVSPATRWTHINWELDSARTSGVVKKYGIFTIGEYAGYAAPNYRDGQSIVQGPTGSPTYDATYTGMKAYITAHPSWGGTVYNLIGQAHSTFKTFKAGLGTRSRATFKTKMKLATKPHSTFKININPFKLLTTLAKSVFKIQVDNDPMYAHGTFTAVDGFDTFTSKTDGKDSMTGIG